MSQHFMKCGHTANAVRSDGKPACVICAGIVPGWDEVETQPPSLEGRKARCAYGQHAEVESSFSLAFFEYTPNKTHDTYYCGCHGWD